MIHAYIQSLISNIVTDYEFFSLILFNLRYEMSRSKTVTKTVTE